MKDQDMCAKQFAKLENIQRLLHQHLEEAISSMRYLLLTDEKEILEKEKEKARETGYDDFQIFIREIDMDEWEDVMIDYQEFIKLMEASFVLVQLKFAKTEEKIVDPEV